MKKIYIVAVLGYWGRGKTLKEAATQCVKAGGRKNDKALVWLVLGDDNAGIDTQGRSYHEEYAKWNVPQWDGNDAKIKTEMEIIGKGFSLGSLIRLMI